VSLSDAAQGILNTVATLFLAALPAGLGVAILRYRLYEIDRIISRTLAYAIVTGLLVGVMRWTGTRSKPTWPAPSIAP
jgi:hypothetical protein